MWKLTFILKPKKIIYKLSDYPSTSQVLFHIFQVPDEARDVMCASKFKIPNKNWDLFTVASYYVSSFSWHRFHIHDAFEGPGPFQPKVLVVKCKVSYGPALYRTLPQMSGSLSLGVCGRWLQYQNHAWPFSHKCKREKEKDKGWGSAPSTGASRLKKHS